MKSLLLTLMLAMGAITASAQNYDYMILHKTDGTVQGIATDGLKLTFENGNLVADNGKDTQTVAMSQMWKLTFSSDITSVESATVDNTRINVSVVDGKLCIDAPEGSKIKVYGIDGRQVRAENLTNGVYVVRVNNKSFKVLVK